MGRPQGGARCPIPVPGSPQLEAHIPRGTIPGCPRSARSMSARGRGAGSPATQRLQGRSERRSREWQPDRVQRLPGAGDCRRGRRHGVDASTPTAKASWGSVKARHRSRNTVVPVACTVPRWPGTRVPDRRRARQPPAPGLLFRRASLGWSCTRWPAQRTMWISLTPARPSPWAASSTRPSRPSPAAPRPRPGTARSGPSSARCRHRGRSRSGSGPRRCPPVRVPRRGSRSTCCAPAWKTAS